jgi:hypothetical protein
MPFKPMKLKQYLALIRKLKWTLEKGSIDHKLYDAEGKYLTHIKIIHPPGNEVHPDSVKKTLQLIKEAGH